MFNYTKKILILSLLASGWSASLQAATGISQKHVNEIRAVMGSLPVQGAQTSVLAAGEDAVTLLDEDFSKFTEGTEAEPNDVNIADNQTGVIPAEYTNVPGWSGAAIYQAGQTCAIRLGLFLDGSSSQPVSLPGVLYTPVGNYAGNGTLTFRAKLLNSTVESDVMAIAMIDANQETAYTELKNISGIISKNGRNDAKQLNVSVVTVSNDAKPKMLKKQRKAELSRRTVCKSLPDEK